MADIPRLRGDPRILWTAEPPGQGRGGLYISAHHAAGCCLDIVGFCDADVVLTKYSSFFLRTRIKKQLFVLLRPRPKGLSRTQVSHVRACVHAKRDVNSVDTQGFPGRVYRSFIFADVNHRDNDPLAL